MTDFARYNPRRYKVTHPVLGRRQLMGIAAAFALLMLLVYAFQGTEQAAAQSSGNNNDDLETVVAAGNDVQGKSETSGKNETSGQAMPQTGAPIERPLLVGLVLLLDGALLLMLTQRKPVRAFSPH